VNLKTLLIVTAACEVPTGILLLIAPTLTSEFLLGEGPSSPQAFVIARIAGVALVSIGVACWLLRTADRSSQRRQLIAVLTYNLAVPILLIQSRLAASVGGPGLWPASVLHLLLAGWCVAGLRVSPR